MAFHEVPLTTLDYSRFQMHENSHTFQHPQTLEFQWNITKNTFWANVSLLSYVFIGPAMRISKKIYSTQHCFLHLLEKWKNSVDKGNYFGALLTDHSKAFECLDHELLTAKLNSYVFTLPALRLIHDYLSNGKQRTMIDDNYSSWSKILFCVPQESIPGPLLFNIFLADLFFCGKKYRYCKLCRW